MISWLPLALRFLLASFRSRRNLLFENLALRHQLLVLNRSSNRPHLTPLDRALWAWLSHVWQGWKNRLCLVRPTTVLQRHRAGFRLFWRWKSRPRTPGRKAIMPHIIRLIRKMSRANPLSGAPCIHGELLKLGLVVAQRTVAQYMIARASRPPSQNWKTFLRHHLSSMVSVDFLTVPTLTFQVLYVLIVLSHHRRRTLRCRVGETADALPYPNLAFLLCADKNPPSFCLSTTIAQSVSATATRLSRALCRPMRPFTRSSAARWTFCQPHLLISQPAAFSGRRPAHAGRNGANRMRGVQLMLLYTRTPEMVQWLREEETVHRNDGGELSNGAAKHGSRDCRSSGNHRAVLARDWRSEIKGPIVEEVRRIQHEHEQRCKFDLEVVLADIQQHQ